MSRRDQGSEGMLNSAMRTRFWYLDLVSNVGKVGVPRTYTRISLCARPKNYKMKQQGSLQGWIPTRAIHPTTHLVRSIWLVVCYIPCRTTAVATAKYLTLSEGPGIPCPSLVSRPLFACETTPYHISHICHQVRRKPRFGW